MRVFHYQNSIDINFKLVDFWCTLFHKNFNSLTLMQFTVFMGIVYTCIIRSNRNECLHAGLSLHHIHLLHVQHVYLFSILKLQQNLCDLCQQTHMQMIFKLIACFESATNLQTGFQCHKLFRQPKGSSLHSKVSRTKKIYLIYVTYTYQELCQFCLCHTLCKSY